MAERDPSTGKAGAPTGGPKGADPDPTQMLPAAPPGADEEVRRILEQQHTGNHGKPAGENADARGGSRSGAENVEPASGTSREKESG